MARAKSVRHFEMEQGRKYFYGIRTRTNYRKGFHSFLKPLARDMFTPSTWSGTHIETLCERRKTSPNPEGGGVHQRIEATLEQCSTLR